MELRKTAQARIEAAAKAARTTIEARSLEVQTELLAAGLTSDAARAFLASMPTPAQLMPTVDVEALAAIGGRSSDESRRADALLEALDGDSW